MAVSILFIEIIFMLLSILLFKFDEQKQKYILVVFIFLYSIFVIIFSTASLDYEAYLRMYKVVGVHKNYGFSLWDRHLYLGCEYGYLYFMLAFKAVFGDVPRLFFGFTSIISSMALMFGFISLLKNKETLVGQNEEINNLTHSNRSSTSNYPLMFVFSTSYFGLCYQANAIRAGISMAFVVFFISRMEQKKYLSAVISLIVSILIHRMGILGIVVWIVYKFAPKISEKAIKIIWIILGIMILGISRLSWLNIGYTMIEVFLQKFPSLAYDAYLSGAVDQASVSKGMIFTWLMGWLPILFSYRDNNYKLFNVFSVGVIISVLFSMVPGAGRIADYFVIFNIPVMYQFYTNADRFTILTRKVIVFVCIVVYTMVSLRILHLL